MTQEERQQKFELFVEAMNVPLEVKSCKTVKKPFIFILLSFLFYASLYISIILLPFSIDGKYINIIYIDICLFIFGSLGLFLLLRKKKKDKKVEMIINYNGIYTHEVGFWGWDDIHDEHIRYDKNIESPKWYLCYECPNGSVRLLLSDYDEGAALGIHYLKQYREFHYIKKNTFNL